MSKIRTGNRKKNGMLLASRRFCEKKDFRLLRTCKQEPPKKKWFQTFFKVKIILL